ncbi:MAG: SIMPL domain-containing protein [bacterium]
MIRLSFIFIGLFCLILVTQVLAETFTFTIPDVYLKGGKIEPVTLQVTGTGIVKSTPDQVIISAYIYTQNKKASVAFEDNQYKMRTLMDALIALGVPKQNIVTESLSIETVYKENSAKVDYFYVSRSIKIKQEDMNTISPILDALIDAQIEEIGSIQFVVKDMEARYKEALEKAATDCKETAESIASTIGARIVNLKSLTYSFGGYYPPAPRSEAADELRAMESYNQMIVPGETTTTVNVYATYIIEYMK